MTDTPDTPDTPAELPWVFHRAFAEHFGAARDALAQLRRPRLGQRGDGDESDLLAWGTAHALLAIAAALDPDTAASVQRGEPSHDG